MDELSAEEAAANRVEVDAVSIRNGYVYWLEKRPTTGRTTLVRTLIAGDDLPQTVTPEQFDVGSRVHEYGGGAYWVAEDGTAFVVNETDQRIYRLADGDPQPLTPDPATPAAVRYADLRTLPSGRLICVRERHEPDGQVINELITLPADGSGAFEVVAEGRDFYSFPRPNPAGSLLAFTCWDNPQMPWDGTELWVAEIAPDGAITGGGYVAGGPDESLFQPEWSPDGQLYVMSDRTGWWNLCRVDDGELLPVWHVEAECGEPQWEFGYSTYAFLDARRVVVLIRVRGEDQLWLLDVPTGRAEQLQTETTSIKAYVAAADGHIAYVGSAADHLPGVVVQSMVSREWRTVAQPPNPLEVAFVRTPERHWVPTSDRPPIPIWVYSPASGEPDQLPPLIVRPHPGPTSQARARLDLEVQFFTSHGFGVALVDYRGSTGYGRAYRDALTQLWGIADAEDCISVALWLIEVGKADPARIVISGVSAGGFTALRALADCEVFAAASCVSGIVDLLEYRGRTHKFQQHELDRLVGKLPASLARYERRSPAASPGQIDRPVFFAHSVGDAVAPSESVVALAEALSAQGTQHEIHLLEQNGHPPVGPEVRAALLEAEVRFYHAVFDGIARSSIGSGCV